MYIMSVHVHLEFKRLIHKCEIINRIYVAVILFYSSALCTMYAHYNYQVMHFGNQIFSFTIAIDIQYLPPKNHRQVLLASLRTSQ